MSKKNVIITIISVLILTCIFAFARTTTTDLGLVKPTWTEDIDILADLNANSDMLEAFANDPLEFDSDLERLEDRVGAMFTGNTETGLTLTYQDADNTIDAVIGADDIVESMIKFVNLGNDEEIVTRETATGDFEYHTLAELSIQPLDATLTALAGLTIGANELIYGTGADAFSMLSVNATATNKFLRQVSSGAPAWATLVAGDIPDVSATYQPLDTALTNISALAYVSPSLIKLTANDTYAVRTLAEVKTDLAYQLSDMSDVGATTPTDKYALMADGDSWESRALVEADISNLGTYLADITGESIFDLSDVTADPNADKYPKWDDDPGEIVWVDVPGYTNLTSFVDQTAWRVFYSNTDGDVVELALGDDGTFLGSNGAAVAPTFSVPAGGGDVAKVGTPANSQIGVWTGDGTIEGAASLTYDGSNLQLTGDVGSTGARITKGWFANLETTGDLTVNGTTLASTYANLGVNADITSMTGLDNDGIPLAKVADATSLPVGVVASFFINASDDTPFDADIAGNPTSTSVVYDGETLENSINFVATNLTNCRVVLYNTTRGNSRLISLVDIATNTITTESSTDDWADNDVITIQSTTNLEAGFVDLDFSTGDALPTNAIGILINGYYLDTGGVGNSAVARFHPYAAYDSGKRSDIFGQVASIHAHYGSLLIPITSRRFSYKIVASGTGTADLKMVFVAYVKE